MPFKCQLISQKSIDQRQYHLKRHPFYRHNLEYLWHVQVLLLPTLQPSIYDQAIPDKLYPTAIKQNC